VQPRGLNTFSLASSAAGGRSREPEIEGMASWGATSVRLQLGQHLALEGMCEHDPSYLARIDERVRWITERGMLALLDLHRTTRGDPCGDTVLQRAPDRLSLAFWKLIATRYKDNPLVAFDLFNEPHDISADTWRDGGTIEERDHRLIGGSTVAHRWDAVGMQQLYDVVRATGARNLVVVSGTNWATDPRVHVSHPLDGWGIVAAIHVYCRGCGGALPPDLGWKVRDAATTLPVLITEFGSVEDSGAYNSNLIRWAEHKGFGWMAHAWAALPPDEFGLLESWEGFRPSRQGAPVRDGLLRAR
jgi:hypothetical protein